MSGLRVDVYRRAGSTSDLTNGGISGSNDVLYVMNIPDGNIRNEDLNDDDVVAVLDRSGSPILVPAIFRDGKWKPEHRPNQVGPMHGGNFAQSCDSRWSSAVERLAGHRIYGAIAIHDRFETQEQYDILSR